ncbi:MAG: metalloregulator ArsR/SmtB family transcription factor [Acidimicrobiia bacterium]
MVTGVKLDRTFAALGDPARRTLVRMLSSGPATVKELADPFAMTRPAISKHLRVLKDAGIVTATTRGRQNWYSLESGALAEADSWLAEVQNMWADALGSLKAYVEEVEDVDGA